MILLFTAAPVAAQESDYWSDLAVRGAASGNDPCAYAGRDAAAIVQYRYAGATVPQMIAAAPVPEMALEAAALPRMVTAEGQARQVASYREDWEMRCYDAIGAPLSDRSTADILADMNRRLDELGY